MPGQAPVDVPSDVDLSEASGRSSTGAARPCRWVCGTRTRRSISGPASSRRPARPPRRSPATTDAWWPNRVQGTRRSAVRDEPLHGASPWTAVGGSASRSIRVDPGRLRWPSPGAAVALRTHPIDGRSRRTVMHLIAADRGRGSQQRLEKRSRVTPRPTPDPVRRRGGGGCRDDCARRSPRPSPRRRPPKPRRWSSAICSSSDRVAPSSRSQSSRKPVRETWVGNAGPRGNAELARSTIRTLSASVAVTAGSARTAYGSPSRPASATSNEPARSTARHQPDDQRCHPHQEGKRGNDGGIQRHGADPPECDRWDDHEGEQHEAPASPFGERRPPAAVANHSQRREAGHGDDSEDDQLRHRHRRRPSARANPVAMPLTATRRACSQPSSRAIVNCSYLNQL